MARFPRMLLPFLDEPDFIGPPTAQQLGVRLTTELGTKELLRVIEDLEIDERFEDKPGIYLQS